MLRRLGCYPFSHKTLFQRELDSIHDIWVQNGAFWVNLIFSILSQGSRRSLRMHIEGLRSSQRIATNLPLISKAGGSPEHILGPINLSATLLVLDFNLLLIFQAIKIKVCNLDYRAVLLLVKCQNFCHTGIPEDWFQYSSMLVSVHTRTCQLYLVAAKDFLIESIFFFGLLRWFQ